MGTPLPFTSAQAGPSIAPHPAAPDGAGLRRARVLVADDSPEFLTLLCDVIRKSEHLELVGAANCGETAVQLALELKPAIAVIDVNMPGLGGIEAARQIKAGAGLVTVVLISATSPSELPRVAHSIADAVVSKDDLAPELLERLGTGSHDGGG